MDGPSPRAESLVVALGPEALYDLVSDVTRTGEWSPVCRECWWAEGTTPGQVGARFHGRNDDGTRTWETVSTVVAAERGREFAWLVGDGFVRWGFTFEPVDGGTRLTESWHFLPAGLAMFRHRYGEKADEAVANRTRAATDGIPATLATIKRIAEKG